MKPHTYTNRSLCECELYTPANYDNDPQMKEVMDNFNRQTQQRFEEYDERMKTTRQKCKDRCDKEIQKIILKDKLEKQMEEQLTTLETKIDTDDIPTCICEKSIADKTEKFCLNCGKTMGGVAPAWGLVCGVGYAVWTPYFATTVAKAATDAGIKAGLKVGLVKVTEIAKLSLDGTGAEIPTIDVLKVITAGEFTDDITLHGISKCISSYMSSQPNDTYSLFSLAVDTMAKKTLSQFNSSYRIPVEAVETAFAKAKEGVLAEGASKTSSLTTGITASIIAIVVIVLIMVIIYLILRYRRKKKMKKKLQYIKLLEE
ncbi:rifin [Plasmodium falciparum IGH-CR14]|uniref:Rifin n=1 Tax=Plasmodium falciparum IGH-CR14 TaxID=580059 RepID=A0A0L1I6X7_PLAFA|nr:rifin [Plasmodium falciparum IGH-CR14]